MPNKNNSDTDGFECNLKLHGCLFVCGCELAKVQVALNDETVFRRITVLSDSKLLSTELSVCIVNGRAAHIFLSFLSKTYNSSGGETQGRDSQGLGNRVLKKHWRGIINNAELQFVDWSVVQPN